MVRRTDRTGLVIVAIVVSCLTLVPGEAREARASAGGDVLAELMFPLLEILMVGDRCGNDGINGSIGITAARGGQRDDESGSSLGAVGSLVFCHEDSSAYAGVDADLHQVETVDGFRIATGFTFGVSKLGITVGPVMEKRQSVTRRGTQWRIDMGGSFLGFFARFGNARSGFDYDRFSAVGLTIRVPSPPY